ncbi:MAG: phosphate:Na+ symporter [Pirellulaceae bacterium]|jgi:phosphate:Na+ symporter
MHTIQRVSLLVFLSIFFAGCDGSDGLEIIRVGRPASSGTYAHFRDTVLGAEGAFKSHIAVETSSEKVIHHVAITPGAIGFAGMAFATDEVKALKISAKKGGDGFAPNVENTKSGDYLIARPLYIYVLDEPGAANEYLHWIRSEAGQRIVTEAGFVPIEPQQSTQVSSDGEGTIRVAGSDTMAVMAKQWGETYSKQRANIVVEVAAGGSGVGIEGLVNGSVDVANSSRQITRAERAEVEEKTGKKIAEFEVARDALSVYVHKDSPIDTISIEELAEICGESGKIEDWSEVSGWPKDDFDAMELVYGLVGGLGIFLLGMKNMSEGMQAVAGSSLRKLISVVTNNRIFATIVGVVVTCFVQSSSITTVMVVGFVNGGLMQLSQAIGVIMGANIGTTITGWILVLKIGKYGLPILGAAAFAYLFSRGDRWRYWAMAIMGVGMIFFGLETMKDACAIIKHHEGFEAWFHRFSADSYFGVLQCAMAGCMLTMLVQSSSATLGITISLASQGVISCESACALVLGENIGTTVTAYLASIGATTNARRAAYFHVIFNLLGVFWVTLIFSWYYEIVKLVVNVDVTQVVMKDGMETLPYTTPMIAATHTIFNITNTLIFLPFVPLFVKLLKKIVPAKGFEEKAHLTDLDVRMLETPLFAIEQSRKEIQKMGEGCSNMLDWLSELLQQDDPDKALGDKLVEREQVLDSMQDELAAFVTNLLSANIPHAVADEARRQLRMADEYESVSDYIANLDKFDRKLRRDGHRFTPGQRHDLGQLNRHLAEYISVINQALAKNDPEVVTKTEPMSKRIRGEIKQLRRKHLEELSKAELAPVIIIAYLAALNAYARVRDHGHNIAEAIAGEK